MNAKIKRLPDPDQPGANEYAGEFYPLKNNLYKEWTFLNKIQVCSHFKKHETIETIANNIKILFRF